MPDLTNSQRRLYKATYAPIQPKPSERPARTKRAVAKAAFVSSLAIHRDELDAVKRRLAGEAALAPALAAITAQVGDGSPAAAIRSAQALAPIETDALVRIGQALADERAKVAERVQTLIGTLRDSYRTWLTRPAAASAPAAPASPAAPPPAPAAPAGAPPARVVEGRDQRNRLLRITRSEVATPPAGSGPGGRLSLRAELLPDAGAAAVATAQPTAGIEDAIAWAARSNPAGFAEMRTLTVARAPVPLAYSNVDSARALSYVVAKVSAAAAGTMAAVHAFKEQMTVEPVGRLHLERLYMTPVGMQRGELASSIPLTPKETVNISHREWSVTTEEFESIIQDYFEGYSEQGVAEKSDMAQSTENQTKHSTALTFGASASASYLGVTLSSSLGYNSSSDDQQAQKDSRNHSISSTRQASARTKKDHKTSFKVSSAAGTEDQAVRVITNPSDTESMRVDYYQMMRRWRVDLYRYGLRMTYDIVIPSPGADLMRKIEDLAALDAQIDNPLAFTLAPGDISRSNWESIAAHYQASVDPPPKDKQQFMGGGSTLA